MRRWHVRLDKLPYRRHVDEADARLAPFDSQKATPNFAVCEEVVNCTSF